MHVNPLQLALVWLWRLTGHRPLTRRLVRSLSDDQQAELRHAYARQTTQPTKGDPHG